MSIYVKGSILKQDGNEAVIQVGEEELGRAVLNYIVNNSSNDLGQKFMTSLFSDKPMSLTELIMPKSCGSCSCDNSAVKKNDSAEYNVEENSAVSQEEIDVIIEELKQKENVTIAVESLKTLCPKLYENIVKTKSNVNSKVVADCDIVFKFDDSCVTYSFIYYRNGNPEEITPTNNVVVYYSDVDDIEELNELRYI